MKKYEAIIIGGGPGGYVAGIRLGQLGVKTLLIEREHLGGECLNFGCIPSKVLIESVNLYSKLKNSSWINFTELKVNWNELQKKREEASAKMRSGVKYLLEGNGVKIIMGEARIKEGMRVEVKKNGEKEVFEAENIVIASGSSPASLPTIPYDGERVLTPRQALELKSIPNSLLVVGGGAIGLELGTMYAKLGTKVTIVEIMDQLLPGFEKDLVRFIERRLRKLGVEIYLESKVTSSKIEDNKIVTEIEKRGETTEMEFDYALVSVGKKSTASNIGVNELGVKLDEKGFIKVDETSRTSIPDIYAVGDVTGPPFLAHKASRQGIIAAENIGGRGSKIDFDSIPSAIFTDPELAVVGLTRAEATRRGFKVRIGRFSYSALGRAIAEDEADGFVRIISDSETGKILGVQIIGAKASELISEAALAVRLGLTAEQLAETIHPHPTYHEALMEAAEAALWKPIHMLVK